MNDGIKIINVLMTDNTETFLSYSEGEHLFCNDEGGFIVLKAEDRLLGMFNKMMIKSIIF